MSKRTSEHTVTERIEVVEKVFHNRESIHSVTKRHHLNKITLKEWIHKYQNDGVDGLKESTSWKHYSDELKTQAVEYYLSNPAGLVATCAKFNISTSSDLRDWIKLYTSGKGFKSTSKGRRKMNKGRKTTWKERIEIAQYTIANNLDYHKAEKEYNVSYQQVYQWLRKYQEGGPEALKDRHGRSLESKETLTEEEKLRLEVKKLQQRNQYLEAENGLIKKLKDIERRNQRG